MPTSDKAIACIIRYEIEPTKRHAFVDYARAWGQCIPACGVELIGYFAPHEGSTTTAYGMYYVDGLAHYEAYKRRLLAHPEARANFAFAARERFIRREDRLFLELVSTPHASSARDE